MMNSSSMFTSYTNQRDLAHKYLKCVVFPNFFPPFLVKQNGGGVQKVVLAPVIF